ncbi:MAG: helix-turn-helix domain-containing protein [Sporichthyaceae bacterium]
MDRPVEHSAAHLIKLVRRRREWSQAELARRVGMPASQLCAYESAAKQPSAATLERILRAAGMELGALTPQMERLRQARQLQDVLELSDHLPYRPRNRAGPPSWAELTRR